MRALLPALILLFTGSVVHAAPATDPAPAAMRLIPGGSFLMGSSAAETKLEQSQTMHTGNPSDDDFAPREKPQHEVHLRAFKLSPYLVTRGEYAGFVAATRYAGHGCYAYNGVKFETRPTADWHSPGFPQTDRDPVVCVSTGDAAAYIKWYSAKTGIRYRLPSEAEIEYATRAGTTTSRFWGNDVAAQCIYANGSDLTVTARFPQWYGAPCHDDYFGTSPVGVYAANPWNLYDMLGNVYEMTQDCWHETYAGAPTDGSAWITGDCSRRAFHGGSSSPHPGSMRSASRVGIGANDRTVFTGFRLAQTVP